MGGTLPSTWMWQGEVFAISDVYHVLPPIIFRYYQRKLDDDFRQQVPVKAKKIGLNAHVLVTLTIQYITEFGIFWVTWELIVQYIKDHTSIIWTRVWNKRMNSSWIVNRTFFSTCQKVDKFQLGPIYS